MPNALSASQVPNQFVECNGRRLAYRVIGDGTPMVLCLRFRGVMDSWDPAFLDELAELGFKVHVFDYSGLGLSGGPRTYDPASLARDTLELIAALGLSKVVLGGWSLGGIAAQVVMLPATSPWAFFLSSHAPPRSNKSLTPSLLMSPKP